jgi:hypothetical protein
MDYDAYEYCYEYSVYRVLELCASVLISSSQMYNISIRISRSIKKKSRTSLYHVKMNPVNINQSQKSPSRLHHLVPPEEVVRPGEVKAVD